jgi:alkylation response protein AidB-like acyl-CoA dehydrogenase
MDVELPEDIRLLQRTVRGFVDDVLAPRAKEIEDKDEIPRALITQMGEAGLFGIGHAEELGGQGFGKLGYCVAVEQLARVNASLWNVIGGSAGLCGTAISVGGPDDVRRRYLPDLFSARKVGAKGRRVRAVRAWRRQ